MNAPQHTAPYHVEGADRTSRWVITCDHASNRVPPDVGGGDLGLPPADMERHIAYDVGAAGVARALAEALDAPVILSDFSRLVIDPNRGEDDPTLLMKVYDGSIIPANRHADAAEVERRLARYHRPYHTAIESLIASRYKPGRGRDPFLHPAIRRPPAPAMACGRALCRGHAPCPAPSCAPERGAGPLCRRQPAVFGAPAGRRAGPARGADGPAPCPDRGSQRPDRDRGKQRAWGRRLAPMLDAALRISEV
jgi:hypothetical protein